MDLERLQLSSLDYLVFGVSLLVSLAIGLYYSCSKPNQAMKKVSADINDELNCQKTDDYLLGSRQMGVLPVSFSLMASFMSAITLIGVPSEIYSFSIQFVFINASYILATPIAVYVYLPVFYRLHVTSVYEYLEQRFDRHVRLLASSLFMLQMITYMGIVLYAPALALSAVTSLPKWTSVIVVGMVCTLYCATGGIKAVLWTDVFQSVLMFLCLSLMAIVGTCNVGGLYKVIEVSIRGDRLTGPNLSFDPTERHTLWSLMFGGIFIYLSLYGVNQTQVQRLLTVRSLSAAQKCLWMSWPLTTVLSLLTCFTGLVMYANYADCDPLLSGRIRRRDQLVPFFMMQLFHAQPGLAGVVIAGIFAGSLSTVSSFVNSLAAVSLHDLIRPLVTQHSFDRHSLIYTKLLACFYGLLCLLVAYLAEQVSGLLEASLSIFSLVGGPLLGVFTLGMCSSRCTGRAALVALLVSLGFGLWMCLGAHFASISPPLLVQSISGCSNITFSLANTNSVPVPTTQLPFYLYRISYMWVAAITFIVAIVTGVSISFAFSPKLSQQIDPRLLSSFVILDFVVSKSKPKSSVQLQDCTTY